MCRKNGSSLWLFSGILMLFFTFQAAEIADGRKSPGHNPVPRKIVKIYVKSQEEMNKLASLVEPWEVHKDYIITDADEKIMQQIMDKGFPVEVLFWSVEELMTSSGRDLPQPGQEGAFHSYSEIRDELSQLASANPQIAMVHDIGDSWETTQGIADRDILAIKISDNVAQEEGEPEILFIGAHHAREWISVEVPFYLAKHLIENYDSDPLIRSFVDNGEIWIVPMVNPDGHQYSIDAERLWRKNRRDNGDGTYGVDLNRNYSYMWGGPGSSPDTWSEIYRGTEPFSEPETQAIRDLSSSHDFRAVLSYHSYGQFVLHPWDHTIDPPPDTQMLNNLTIEMANLIQQVHGEVYFPMQGSLMYQVSGSADDWFYGEQGTFCFTIELRPVGYPGFILPESEIIPTMEENGPAALHLINWIQTPTPYTKANGSDGHLTITQSDTLSVTVELDAGSSSGEDADWWAVADTPFGWYYYYDVKSNSWKPGQKVTYQGSLFDLTPPFEVLNMSGLPTGTYTFFFGVDMNMDGSISYGRLYYSSVVVDVTG